MFRPIYSALSSSGYARGFLQGVLAMAGGVHMLTEKARVSPAIWVGIMGIGTVSIPTCAYELKATVTPFNSNSVSAFIVGFAVGLLITVGAFVVYARVAKRRRRAGESLEATIGPTEFSMPVGDDPQAVVDVLGLGMAFEDQAASLRQVERFAKSYEAPANDAARAPRSVREVLSRRLDGNGLGVSSVIGRADGALARRRDQVPPVSGD